MERVVLVTGATGYIGGRLVAALERAGHRVRCLARRPETLHGRVGVDVVARMGEKIGGIKVNIPPEPMIAGAVGAALFAFDRARMKASA